MEEFEKELLKQAGINAEEAMERFMENEKIFKKFLHKFLEDTNFRNMKTFLEERNTKGAFAAAHTVKGVAGNLSMNGLYNSIKPLVECLREDDLETALKCLPEVEKVYDQSVKIIRELNY